jgi:hypothetical protein
MNDDYRGAVSYAEKPLQIYATHTPSFLIMIANLVRLGRLSEAKENASRLVEVSPGYRILPNAPVFEFFTSELAAAGLSEMPASG